jgi:hypothetical protein
VSHVYHSPRCTARPGRSATNGLGIAGFVISIASVLTCGLTSPIGLLLSLVALRRQPRGFATAGTILGGLGTAMIVGMSVLTLTAGHSIKTEIENSYHANQTLQASLRAQQAIETYRAEHGALPEGIPGNKLVVVIADAWGEALRYDVDEGKRYLIRSAGPDQQFDTADDLVHQPEYVLHEPIQAAPRPARRLRPK